jgi:hypothetical protein
MLRRQRYIQAGQLQLGGAYISAGGGASAITSAFLALVTANGGTFESPACTQNVIASLLSINLN